MNLSQLLNNMNEKARTRKRWISIPAVILILTLAFAIISSDKLPFIRLAFGAPDSYGNDIYVVYIQQYSGTSWEYVYNFTASGQNTRVHDGWQVGFYVVVKLNYTLATDAAGAKAYTRVNMTLTNMTDLKKVTGWDNVVLNNTGTPWNDGTAPTSFWYCPKQGNWTAELPIADMIYNCTFAYQPKL